MSLLSPFAGPDPDHPRCWHCLQTIDRCLCASQPGALNAIGALHPRLATMRAAIQSGAYADDTGNVASRKLEFLRWLVQHGKLGGE